MLSQDELVVHLKKLDRKQREILKSLVKSIHLRQFIVTSLTSPQVKLENTTKNTTLINNKDKLVAAHAELIETLLTGDFKRILKDYELSNRIITAAHDAANRYYKKYESGNHTQLSYTEFEEIGDILKDCSKISQKYDHVMNLVVNNFYNLILSRANKYLLGRNSLRSDAVQEGFIGLLDGINRYDLSRGFKLSTYITHWIDMRIRRFLYSSEDLLYFKEKFITEKHKISGQIARLEQKMGKNLTITEACKILGVDQARYASLLVTTNNFSDLSDVDSLIVDSFTGYYCVGI